MSNSNSAYSSRNRRNQEQPQHASHYFQVNNTLSVASGSSAHTSSQPHELPKPTNSETLLPPPPSASSFAASPSSSSRPSYHNNSLDFGQQRDTRGSGPRRDYRDQKDTRGYRDSRDSRGSSNGRDNDYRDRGYSRDNYGNRRDYRNDSRDNYNRNNRRDNYNRGSGERRDYRSNIGRYGNNRAEDSYHTRRDYRPNDSRSNKFRTSTREDDLANVDLTDVIPLDKLPRDDSKWDIKPKGFENVSSEKAKISGFFPLPGEKRKIDISKLEGLVSNGDLASTSILFDAVDIEPFSSHMSKILRITDIEFTLFPVDRLLDSIKAFILNLKGQSGFIVRYDLKILPITNKQYLVVEFSDGSVATDVFCSVGYFQEALNLKDMTIERPDGYVSYEGDDDEQEAISKPVRRDEQDEYSKQEEEDEEDEEFLDNSRKLAVQNVPSAITPDSLKELLTEKVGPILKFKPLLNNDGKIQGIVYVEFKGITTGQAIVKISQLTIEECPLSAIEASNSPKIQTSKITYRNLEQISQIGDKRVTKVLILLNLIKPEHLKSQSTVQELHEDIQFKLSQFGVIESVKIPTPQSADYKKSIKTIDSNIGKVYVKFKDLASSKLAKEELKGMRYNGRTVVCSFWEELDFDLGIL